MENIPEGFVDVSESKDGGVWKKILREGSVDSQPNRGDEVSVHYVGTLFGGENDGEKFDSSRDRNSEFQFKLGEGQVIKAWDQGVATMKKGELCELICSPEYAYGANGSPPKIPANATLKFEVELFRWKGEDLSESKDGGITRSILKKGQGYANPQDGCKVTINAIGRFTDGTVFEDVKELNFDLGDGANVGVCMGVEVALKKMKLGEVSRLHLLPSYAFGKEGKPSANVPTNAEVDYEITLINFDKFKESYELESSEERLAESEAMKNRGTDYFKKGNFNMAKVYYEKSVSYLDLEEMNDNEDHKSQRSTLLLASYLNLSLCELKLGNYGSSVDQCDKALNIDANNEKAYFRKGQAEFSRQNYEEAREMFQRVTGINRENKAAFQHLAQSNQKIKALLQQERDMCKNIFSKLLKPEPVKQNGAEKVNATESNQDKMDVGEEVPAPTTVV